MKLNLDFPLLDLNGEDATVDQFGKNGNKSIGNVVATLLIRADIEKESEILKYWKWANELNSGKAIELDEGDKTLFKDYLMKHKQATVLLKAKVLEYLDLADKNGKQTSKSGKSEGDSNPT